MRTATADVPNAANATGAEPTTALKPGARLGAYELLSPLASGGMGHVWSALRLGDFGFRRTVAIKVMREELSADPGFRTMFLDEARLASRISHTNVVEVLDLGESGGVLFLAMALVEGDSLAHLIDAAAARGTVRDVAHEVTARIGADVLRGLHAAHSLRSEAGEPIEFVHRDVSPQNILVGQDGVAKLTDFGVAKAEGAKASRDLSNRKGKLAYMAPEQFRSEAIDRRADLYALGVVLWELLAGARLPEEFRGERAGQGVPHPSMVNPKASRALGDVIMRAVRADPADRFSSAEEMADALEGAAHAEGIALSSKSVAAWVNGLASERILRRRHDTEAQLARTQAGTATTLPGDVEPRAGSPRKGAATALLAAGAAALLLIGLGGVAWRRAATSRVTETASAPSAMVTEAPPPDVSMAQTPSSSVAPAAPPTASHPPTPTAPLTSASAAPRGKTNVARPQRPSKPKPKYGNPYEGAP
ncbi:MAG: protein kinase [Myxococcales bacterium]|nr:protein kinase [Myxococcales bacterium]